MLSLVYTFSRSSLCLHLLYIETLLVFAKFHGKSIYSILHFRQMYEFKNFFPVP